MRVVISNPLPRTLHHYGLELQHCLSAAGVDEIGSDGASSVEGLAGTSRAVRGLQILGERQRVPDADLRVVAWPALGYFDAWSWVRGGRRGPLVLIVHDVEPLQRQFGYGRTARRAFRHAVLSGGLHVVCHTTEGGKRLRSLTAVDPSVVAHPMLPPVRSGRPAGARPVVRVLGQYKDARDLEVLVDLAQAKGSMVLDLEVWGRGWPAVPGWRVVEGFVDEARFAYLVASADVIAVPYAEYWQSGVMVRAAEAGIPVVGVPHPQLAFLFGDGWPGRVEPGGTWFEAVQRAMSARGAVHERAIRAHESTVESWRLLVREVRGG